MSHRYVIIRSFHANALRRFPKSSQVVTEETQTYLHDKKKLKPEISIYESVRQWSHIVYNPMKNLKAKQDKVMQMAFPGYYGSEDGKLRASNNKVAIDQHGNYLNEIKVENGVAPLKESADGRTNNLVMLHGYGSALGLFYKNFHDLIADQPESRIYSLDLLGFGLSSKPKFDGSEYKAGTKEFPILYDDKNLTAAKHVHKSLKLPDHYSVLVKDLQNYNLDNQLKLITKVEDYYIDALESWRIQNKLENFTLFGHSLGGYLSIAYALKYPTRVEKLVLVSPGGVERSPFAITNPLFSKAVNSTDDERIDLKPSISVNSYDFLGRYPLLSGIYKKLWNYQVGPFTILRKLGPWSYHLFYRDMFRKLTRNISNFKNIQELKNVIDYLYNSVMIKSTQEYLIMNIFASSVVGKYPMYDRIQHLKAKKTIWLFGEYDFMFNSIGAVSSKKMQSLGIHSDFKIIPKSGHNLYFDNWKEFNKELKKFLQWK